MAKKKDNSWQYTFSTALAGVTLLLVIGYFVQSFIEIRKVKPVSVAIERIKNTSAKSQKKYEDSRITHLKTTDKVKEPLKTEE